MIGVWTKTWASSTVTDMTHLADTALNLSDTLSKAEVANVKCEQIK